MKDTINITKDQWQRNVADKLRASYDGRIESTYNKVVSAINDSEHKVYIPSVDLNTIKHVIDELQKVGFTLLRFQDEEASPDLVVYAIRLVEVEREYLEG